MIIGINSDSSPVQPSKFVFDIGKWCVDCELRAAYLNSIYTSYGASTSLLDAPFHADGIHWEIREADHLDTDFHLFHKPESKCNCIFSSHAALPL